MVSFLKKKKSNKKGCFEDGGRADVAGIGDLTHLLDCVGSILRCFRSRIRVLMKGLAGMVFSKGLRRAGFWSRKVRCSLCVETKKVRIMDIPGDFSMACLYP